MPQIGEFYTENVTLGELSPGDLIEGSKKVHTYIGKSEYGNGYVLYVSDPDDPDAKGHWTRTTYKLNHRFDRLTTLRKDS